MRLPATCSVSIVLLLLLNQLLLVSSFSDSKFVQILTKQHNVVRAMHSVPSLALNNTISTRAQRWANELARLSKPGVCLYHSNEGGENIYYYWSTEPIDEQELAESVVVGFYEEIKQYNYAKPGFAVPTAHFTQMVWKATTQMGVGITRRTVRVNHHGCGLKKRYEANLYFVVVHYEPHGNIISRDNFEANVKKPLRSVDDFLKKFVSRT